MGWMAAVGRDRLRAIGILELLGASGFIRAVGMGILPWLTLVAATCLVVTMVFAIVQHARRPEDGTTGFPPLSMPVIAVTKDAEAPIIEFADMVVVGDLFQVAPALVAELRARAV